MELSQVKQNLNTVVSYNNTAYILTGCTIRRDKKQAELADINARSVLIVKLGDIKAKRRDEFG